MQDKNMMDNTNNNINQKLSDTTVLTSSKIIAALIWLAPSLISIFDKLMGCYSKNSFNLTSPVIVILVTLLTLMISKDEFLRSHAASRLAVQIASWILLALLSLFLVLISISFSNYLGMGQLNFNSGIFLKDKFAMFPLFFFVLNVITYVICNIYIFISIIVGAIQAIRGKLPNIWPINKLAKFIYNKIRVLN